MSISDTTPLPIVFITICPCNKAPVIVKIANKRSAFLSEIIPEPTATLVGLAASFPPIFIAIINDSNSPITKNSVSMKSPKFCLKV